jgi:hypothetical protein
MPSNWGQTGYKHKDHEVQREFERVGRSFGGVDKDIAEIKNVLSPSSPASEPKELEVLVDMNSVTKPTYQLNFSGEGDVEFEVRQTDDNQATVIGLIKNKIGDSAITDYETSWELREHADFTISEGFVENLSTTIQDTINGANLDVMYTGGGYPQTNNGNGWIPFSCDKEVIEDITGNVSSEPLIYSTGLTKNAFVFKPPVNGIYKINALLYIKAIMEMEIATQYKWYDNIDQGMLIVEKINYDSLFGATPTYTNTWNPIKNTPVAVGSPTSHDHTYAILDMKSRFGDLDQTRSYSTTFLTPYYADTSGGSPDGLYYHRDIQLGNSVNMALTTDDCIIVWYKLYGRRLKYTGVDGLGNPIMTNVFPNLFYIEDRSERIDVEYVGPMSEDDEIDKQSVIEIVRRF